MDFLFILFLLLQISASDLCHPTDKAALTAFNNGFLTPNPFPSWDPTPDCCRWNGVTCNQTTNFVTGLDIAPYETLNGTIPSSISNLKHLQSLRFHKTPFLVGQIPPALAKLSNLRYLVISWTGISGPIPNFLSQLHNIEYLDLSFNHLSSSIPPYLPSLPFLSTIDLSRNQLMGTIPETFGNFQKTAGSPSIDFSHNKLSGQIPASLSNVNFFSVDVSRNNLSGDASALFGEGKSADRIVISRNGFEFDFSEVSIMESLFELDISHNKIYGTIPKQMTLAVDEELG